MMEKDKQKMQDRLAKIKASTSLGKRAEEPRPIKRTERRESFYRGVACSQNGSQVECIIRDINTNGARLVLESASDLADAFRLSIPVLGRTELVEVVWRNISELGVKFKPR